MPADREYARLLRMAVTAQLKADEAQESGLQAQSAEYLQRANAFRDRAKALVTGSRQKSRSTTS